MVSPVWPCRAGRAAAMARRWNVCCLGPGPGRVRFSSRTLLSSSPPPSSPSSPASSTPPPTTTATTTATTTPPKMPLPDLPTGRPPSSVLTSLFGPHISPAHAYYFLKALHFRRTSGTLLERGVTFDLYPQLTVPVGTAALEWLRQNFPVDEAAAAKAWIDAEVESAIEEEEKVVQDGLVTTAEKWRIYKPERGSGGGSGVMGKIGGGRKVDIDDVDALMDKIEAGRPGADATPKERLGRELSVLDAIKRRNEARYQDQLRREEEEEQERQRAIEEGRDTGIAVPGEKKSFWEGVVAVEKTPEQEAERQAQLEDGMVSKAEAPPEMSPARRLGPSAAVTLAVLLGCVGLSFVSPSLSQSPSSDADNTSTSSSESTTPTPTTSMSTTLTIGTLVLTNVAIFIAWRRPGLWKLLNTHFIVVAGQPRPWSILGSLFSHTASWHVVTNTCAVVAIGSRLHELIGTSDFLSIYLSSGVVSAFGPLAYWVFRNNLTMASLGASGAVWGILAAYLVLVPDGKVPYTVDFSATVGYRNTFEIPAMALLAALLLIDQALVLVPAMAAVGRGAHLVGAATGVVGAKLLQWRDSREKTEVSLSSAQSPSPSS